MQMMDVTSSDNVTSAQYNKHPGVNGQDWTQATPRTPAHTDESMITLLVTSPGETLLW